MTGVLLRIIVFAAIGLFIMYGVRKIWRDWTGKFKADDDDAYRRRRERDRSQHARGEPAPHDRASFTQPLVRVMSSVAP